HAPTVGPGAARRARVTRAPDDGPARAARSDPAAASAASPAAGGSAAAGAAARGGARGAAPRARGRGDAGQRGEVAREGHDREAGGDAVAPRRALVAVVPCELGLPLLLEAEEHGVGQQALVDAHDVAVGGGAP